MPRAKLRAAGRTLLPKHFNLIVLGPHGFARQSSGEERRLRMIGDADVAPAAFLRGLCHLTDRRFSVGVVRVAVQHAANVGEREKRRQRSTSCRVNFAESLAQFRLDERETGGGIDRALVGRRNEAAA